MPFDPGRNEPPSGQRRELFEDLRKNRVPRYLFRAFSSRSSGGPKVSVNTAHEIIPPAFKGHPDPPAGGRTLNQLFPWHRTSESLLERIARSHYQSEKQPLSGFSSWAASIYIAFSLAQWMTTTGHEDVHVAVMDTRELDDDIAVWHLPQILDVVVGGEHEYLAWGSIRGKGYKAVPFSQLQKVDNILPEVYESNDMFNMMQMRHLFATGAPETITTEFLGMVRAISSQFGHLSLPVAVALINVRPRAWVRGDSNQNERRNPTTEELDLVLKELGDLDVPRGLADENWLVDGMVNTVHFPDVEQWICFLRALLAHKVAQIRGATA